MSTSIIAPDTASSAVFEPVTIAFDPHVLTAAYRAADEATRTEVAEACAVLHASTGYTDICWFFDTYLAGTGLTEADTPWFTVTGTTDDVGPSLWIEPSATGSDAMIDGIHIVAALHTPFFTDRPAGRRMAWVHDDDGRGLYGEDTDPLATLLAIGNNVALVLSDEFAAADAYDTIRTPTTTAQTRPRVEVVTVVDPDGPTRVRVFIDGRETDAEVYSVDAGAGWDRHDWNIHRDELLAVASPGPVTDALTAAFADPPGAQYIHTPTTDGL